MNTLDLFTKTYGKLHNYGMPFWIMTPFRRIVRWLANIVLPRYLLYPIKEQVRVEKDLIVSLTSFPARIGDVWKVIECLKRQTILPEKIILWLSEEQFPQKKELPDSLLNQEDDLFEIRFVSDDIRSHKKYYYMFSDFPEKTFITCDDDIFYDIRMIERLVQTSKRFPNCIISNVVHKFSYDNNGDILPYRQWCSNINEYESENLIQVGIGGVLYPTHSLHQLANNKDVFMRIAPLADDIWLNAMARLNKTPIIKAFGNVLVLSIVNNSPALTNINNGTVSMNDKQLGQVREYLRNNGYADVYDLQYEIV